MGTPKSGHPEDCNPGSVLRLSLDNWINIAISLIELRKDEQAAQAGVIADYNSLTSNYNSDEPERGEWRDKKD